MASIASPMRDLCGMSNAKKAIIAITAETKWNQIEFLMMIVLTVLQKCHLMVRRTPEKKKLWSYRRKKKIWHAENLPKAVKLFIIDQLSKKKSISQINT